MRELLFDLDGTLTDSRPGILRSIGHALGELGVAVPSDDALGRYIGPPVHDAFVDVLGPERAHEVEKAVAIFRERFVAIGMFENSVYDGIPDALEALRSRGHRLFVCTVKPEVYALRILEHFGLRAFFNGVYGSELKGRSAEKRELLARALKSERLPPSASTMIGDREHDVLAARELGPRAIGVLWGYGSEAELRAAGAHVLIAAPSELMGATE